jgi:hypothetical protein
MSNLERTDAILKELEELLGDFSKMLGRPIEQGTFEYLLDRLMDRLNALRRKEALLREVEDVA